jgi:hypothetical protein
MEAVAGSQEEVLFPRLHGCNRGAGGDDVHRISRESKSRDPYPLNLKYRLAALTDF